MTLRERLEMLAGIFRVLIIDDGDEKSDVEKGYDALRSAEKFPGLFRVDRAYHFNQREGRGKSGLKYLLEKKYDLILLDCVFHGHSDQGGDMAWAIRSGFEGYRDISAEQGGLNRGTPIFGVSSHWEEKDKETWGVTAIVKADEKDTADHKMISALIRFLRDHSDTRGIMERYPRDRTLEWERRALREMFPGEELQVCYEEVGGPHAWGPPIGAFIRVSNDPLVAWSIHERPGAVYRIGEMDTAFIGASHQVVMFRQPSGQKVGHGWHSALTVGAKRVPAPGIPRLLDLAKWAVMEDATANRHGDLTSTLEMNWTPGARKYGLTVLELTDESNLTDEGMSKGFMSVPGDLRPWLLKQGRMLGDVAEYEGHKFVLVAFIPLDGVQYAAFVPAEEIQL